MKLKFNFKDMVRYTLLSCVVALGLLAIIATGGGGGSVGTSGISYTGLTTQAVVTENNAQDLSAGAYDGGSTGVLFASAGAVQVVRNPLAGHPRTLRISQTFEAAILQVDLVSGPYGTYAGAIQTDSDTVSGECGGTGSYTISVDDGTGAFSGTIQFNAFCFQGTVISGSAEFSGTVNLYTQTLLTYNFSFNNIVGTYGAESVTIQGNILVNSTVSPKTLSMDLLIKDNIAEKVYKMEGYSMNITDAGAYIEISGAGRYYHPDFGYVVISSETPFRINAGDFFPTSGVLVAAGDNNTKARLTSLSSMSCRVEADTDGDGIYDWDSGSLNWSDL